MANDEYFFLNSDHTDPVRLKKERTKARELRGTVWWRQKLEIGICYYCQKKFEPSQLTMDHCVPLARGGLSTKSNLVPACSACNQAKKLQTPVDQILNSISNRVDPRG